MGFSFLHGYAAGGRYDAVAEVLQSSPEAVLGVDDWGCTVLHHACEQGDDSIAELILNSGGECNSRDRFAHTPIYLACKEGHADVVSLLLERSADPEIKNAAGSFPIHAAAASGRNVEVLKVLLEADVVLNSVDGYSNTALHIAAKRGHLDAAELLSKAGMDIQAQNLFGCTPLDLTADTAIRVAIVEGAKYFKKKFRRGFHDETLNPRHES